MTYSIDEWRRQCQQSLLRSQERRAEPRKFQALPILQFIGIALVIWALLAAGAWAVAGWVWGWEPW